MTDRLYERISLDSERSGSIVKQHARLLKVADADDYGLYEERSVSGAKVPFAERPQGSRLLADLRAGDRVLITRIDRAARNVRDLLGLIERIEAAGASIVFVDQNIDTAGPMGRFLLTLLGAVAELEAAIVAERVRESRESFRAEGRFGGGPVPFGFRTVPHPTGRGLVLRPFRDEAGLLTGDSVLARELVERVLGGESQRTLARLAGLGEPGFSRWLRNPLLAGIKPGTAGEVEPDAAILSLVQWARLTEHLDRPKAWTRSDDLAAAFVCGLCGSRLYLGPNKRYPESAVYRCSRRLHADGDPSVAVVRRNAEAHVEREFLARFGRLPVVEEVVVSSSAERDEAIARARLDLDAIRVAQDDAETDEEEEALFSRYRAAKRALRDAEALPVGRVTREVATGQTFGEAWVAASTAERVGFLRRFGPWVVEPGRGLPVGEKVHLPTSEPDYLTGQTA